MIVDVTTSSASLWLATLGIVGTLALHETERVGKVESSVVEAVEHEEPTDTGERGTAMRWERGKMGNYDVRESANFIRR